MKWGSGVDWGRGEGEKGGQGEGARGRGAEQSRVRAPQDVPGAAGQGAAEERDPPHGRAQQGTAERPPGSCPQLPPRRWWPSPQARTSPLLVPKPRLGAGVFPGRDAVGTWLPPSRVEAGCLRWGLWGLRQSVVWMSAQPPQRSCRLRSFLLLRRASPCIAVAAMSALDPRRLLARGLTRAVVEGRG